MSYVFCNQCGHRNPPRASFCSSCGAVLDLPDDRTIVIAQIDPIIEPTRDPLNTSIHQECAYDKFSLTERLALTADLL